MSGVVSRLITGHILKGRGGGGVLTGMHGETNNKYIHTHLC